MKEKPAKAIKRLAASRKDVLFKHYTVCRVHDSDGYNVMISFTLTREELMCLPVEVKKSIKTIYGDVIKLLKATSKPQS